MAVGSMPVSSTGSSDWLLYLTATELVHLSKLMRLRRENHGTDATRPDLSGIDAMTHAAQ